MGVASKLDRFVQFQRATETTDAFGGSTLTWGDHGGVIPALRMDVKDEESVAAGVFRVRSMKRFMTRSTAFTRDIDGGDRIEHEGQLWNIVGIKEPATGQRRQLLEFTVEGPIE